MVAAQPIGIQQVIKFGGDFELNLRSYELRRAGEALKLEPTPFGILALLIEQGGDLVSRQQIVERVWGKGVFLDTDNSINGAIRKIRQALDDDPENPRFIQTITGRGYRFIADLQGDDPPSNPTITTEPSLATGDSVLEVRQPAFPVPRVPSHSGIRWRTAAAVSSGMVVVVLIPGWIAFSRSKKS